MWTRSFKPNQKMKRTKIGHGIKKKKLKALKSWQDSEEHWQTELKRSQESRRPHSTGPRLLWCRAVALHNSRVALSVVVSPCRRQGHTSATLPGAAQCGSPNFGRIFQLTHFELRGLKWWRGQKSKPRVSSRTEFHPTNTGSWLHP